MLGPTRREILAGGLALGAGVLVSSSVAQASSKSKRVLRVAHLTDIHIQPEKRAGEGMAETLRQVNGLRDKPDLILSGGDLIMDAFAASYERTKTQWDLFQSVLKAENSLPIEHCIGNHDVWSFKKREGEEAAK